MIKPTPTCISLALVCLISSLTAQAETQLRPIVTASRYAQTADQTLAAVTVITREDIERSQSQSVSDVLRIHAPGMDFLTTGGPGHLVSPYLRGTNSDHVLFVIDGNVIGSATAGSAQLELLPLEQIERIEVVRGPRSALYGSDAIGGVIQIFTKSSGDSRHASITLGSHETHAVSAGMNIGQEKSQFGLSASHYMDEGFDVTNDSENDDDGYTSNAINLHLKHHLNSSSNIHARWFRAESNTEFDSNSQQNESDSVQQNFTAGIDSRFSNNWNTSLNLGQSQDRLDTQLQYEDFFSPGTFIKNVTLFTTKRDQLHWQNEIAYRNAGQFAFGIDYLNDKVESSSNYSETERDNKALYLLLQDKFDRHQFQVSARVDNNQAFGTHRTGNVAWSYDISGQVQLNLSQGTAFVAPTFNDLYFIDAFFTGNPTLDPETSRSTELGFSGSHDWGQWSYRAYHTEIENLIINVSTNPSDPFAPLTTQNAEQAEINGTEFEIASIVAGWDSQFSLSVVDPLNKSNNTVLQNRARQTLKLNMAQTFGSYRIGVNLLVQSSRFANVSNTLELPGYGIIGFTLEKPLSKHWTFKSRLDNLLDKDYATSVDFFDNTKNNTPISLFITLSYSQ